jgi:hypothetical protein
VTRLFLVSLREDTPVQNALVDELRSFALRGAIVLDGPIKISDRLPCDEAERLRKVAEILKEAARRRRIAEGLTRAKAEGRRIGRPPIDRLATTAQVVLARDSGRSWRSIEEEYHIPVSSARRYYQNVHRKGTKRTKSKAIEKEAGQP